MKTLQNVLCKMVKNGVNKKKRKKGCLKQRWQSYGDYGQDMSSLSLLYSSMSQKISPSLSSQTDAQPGEQ